MKRCKCFVLMLLVFVFVFSSVSSFGEDDGDIKLSAPGLNRGKLLMKALKERKSTREFSSRELDEELLSHLLWAASGINRSGSGKMTAPTATNAQEIDIYVAMKKGLYLYDKQRHTLNIVMPEDIREYTGKQNFTQQAPVNLIFVSNFSRLGGRDEKTKEFYSATDTGYVSQNVYLFCASENLATVVLGWVDRENLAKVMKLKKDQRIILTQPVGYFK